MQSMDVVRTFNRTSFSDRAAYRVRDFRNPVKIQDRTQKYQLPAPSVTCKKIIQNVVLCYLNSGMGSLNIPTENLSRHKIRFFFKKK